MGAMARNSADTPLMRQYLEIKGEHPTAILFFRLGDFYEMFYEDAVVAAEALDLTLTTRDKNKEDPVPMCGVPHHAARGYIRRLIELGHRVAICEQVEDPRTARGVVKRAVTQVVTPGVVVDDDQLDAKCNNYLVALAGPNPPVTGAERGEGELMGLAALDLSTFELRITEAPDSAALLDELVRLGPKEVLYTGAASSVVEPLIPIVGGIWSVAEPELVPDAGAAADLVAGKAEAALETLELEGLSAALGAAALALRYAETTQPVQGIPSCRVIPYRIGDHLQLDEATLQNLEVFRSVREGKRDTSLWAALDDTVTAMGGRLLRRMLALPLLDVAAIRRRQDGVEFLFERPDLRRDLREALRAVADLERLTSRVALQVASPRDLQRLGRSAAQLPTLAARLISAGDQSLAHQLPELLCWPSDQLEDLATLLTGALVEPAPLTARDGGVFRPGYNDELDQLNELAEGGRSAIVALEGALRERTGIGSLKVRFNRVFGYFIEVTRANLKHVPEDFQRKQTLANSERFVTAELVDYEARVLGAQERRNALELELFEQLRSQTAAHAGRLIAAAERLALLDVLCGLAEVAQAGNFVRPEVDDSLRIEIEQGRHPVVERFLPAGQFVPNDLVLDAEGERMLIVTGPNMAGKSTVIRQVALVALIAQTGSFVPCRRARLGIVDRIFTRVGASDNLARGESTFMVEMRETAGILRSATHRSLVVLDEIGRGTATYDGISIAWAVAEFLHDRVRARCLFATHYHELCRLSEVKAHACNYTIAVREWQDRVVFLYRLIRGSASRSYGIDVARLAGLPARVVARARDVLGALEGVKVLDDLPLGGRSHEVETAQLSLLARAATPELPPDAEALLREIGGVDLDRLTPLDALNLLEALRRRAERMLNREGPDAGTAQAGAEGR
jgi:DNA mismatch repair protein MutS